MTTVELLAILASIVLGGVVVFQLGLAAGAPLGAAAWGGKHPGVLPGRLRAGSLVAAVVLAGAAWVVLARAALVGPGPTSTAIRVTTWVFGAVFVLNTLGNLASKSRLERAIMTPATLVLATCFLLVALRGP